MVTYEEIYIRTQYDGKDLMSVEEIYYYDDDGEEQICQEATDACIDISTCADQGADLWSWLREQVESRLRQAKITYRSLFFEDDRGD
ncbi:hypothetical protein SAMN05518845_104136 [Variovorax sp. YR750]|nr:hypothetical protein SAMN05518845_104136 [Variovorax sp. YR750]